jgi:hypothetical protein
MGGNKGFMLCFLNKGHPQWNGACVHLYRGPFEDSKVGIPMKYYLRAYLFKSWPKWKFPYGPMSKVIWFLKPR